MSLKNRLLDSLKNNFLTDDLFWENEIQANQLVAKTLLMCAFVMGLSWFLNIVGVFKIDIGTMNSVSLRAMLELLIPYFICRYFKGEKRWIKYLVVIELLIVLARIDSVLSYDVPLIMLIPLVLSCRYYSSAFTKQIATLTTILFMISAFCGVYLGYARPDLNFYVEGNSLARNTLEYMLRGFLPKWIIFILLAAVCVEIAKVGKQMVEKQDSISRNHARVETELDMAKKIQEKSLPIVHILSEKDKQLFDLAAQMNPAKEVGGDFYDFLYIDSTHIALIIADVSGKGVPAALFMMVSKLLLDNSLAGAVSPAKVLTEVNHQLCEKELEEMFVTVWLGILDLETGKVVASNAGHEYPIIRKNGGDFELFKDKHGFVLGGMMGARYKDYEFELGIGDTLFVYTDGVAEANNTNNELFGLERTLKALNAHKGDSAYELINNVKKDIDSFASGAPQFDDTTMLAITLKKFYEREGITIPVENISGDEATKNAAKYIDKILDEANLSDSDIKQNIKNAIGEIFGSLLKNNDSTFADIYCYVENDTIILRIKDNGISYNAKEDATPLTEDNLKACDDMSYRFENGYNIVEMKYYV